MADRNRRLITQTAGLALAAFAVASVPTPHNAPSASATSNPVTLFQGGNLGGTTLQVNGKALQAPKMDGDDLGSLIHHRYP